MQAELIEDMYKFLTGILLFCFTLVTMATPVTGLYQTKVPVASQSQDLRTHALQQALTKIFIKVSGNSSVVNTSAIQSAIANPENYLLAYRYADGTLSDGSSSLFLHASFDPKLQDDAGPELDHLGYCRIDA